MAYKNIKEEELKNKVGQDWFKSFDTTAILGNIDFTVFPKKSNKNEKIPLLWAEAKTGNYDTITMFVQLILTIGKARTFDKTLPPSFLGCFDFHKIAFIPYTSIQDIFYLNDFNWNVAPSNHDTKEFKLIKDRIEQTLKDNSSIFDYSKDKNELKTFIADNINNALESGKLKIDKNNFVPIYLRWLDAVKPIIDVNWDDLKKASILDSDFYLADLFVDDKDTLVIEDDTSIRDNLFVIFQNQGYKIAKENIKQMFDATINIKAKEQYQEFWKRYKRPPIKEFQGYIIERRDLLVPQDIRERKGAFFTPRQWVELSQKYIADVLGENWQDEYYVWDCAAGTGNLLAGLTNKYNIWASTLDQADVNVMHERIDHGANLLKSHVFQFDFLNDDFTKLPDELQKIINDPEKRKKLVIYINPPYAEVSSVGLKGKAGVNISKMHKKYTKRIGTSGREVYILFFIRIFEEVNGCILCEFSTLKALLGSAFSEFRNIFKAKLDKSFVVPAYTFDNVKGSFPIGFKIWNTYNNLPFKETISDVFDEKGDLLGQKTLSITNKNEFINKWISNFKVENEVIGFLAGTNGNDFQQNNIVYIINKKEQMANPRGIWINHRNLIFVSIYFAVRHCISQTWLNDRDQFLFPNNKWEQDLEFQSDCLAFTLFENLITSSEGTNHWIPFTEQEVEAKEKFESHFMTDFIAGKIKPEKSDDLFSEQNEAKPLEFSAEAKAVFDAGRELWRYYHTQNFQSPSPTGRAGVGSGSEYNPNASLYDIREYFQGRNAKGRMNSKSDDETYMRLIQDLRDKLKTLAKKIEPKVYEYGFLKR